MAVIEVENLRYRYPRQERLALDGITFTVEPGEFIGVIGPNLAGKSTLCQALVGLVPHFYKGAIGGQVRVAGLDVHRSTVAEVSRRAGLVFQNPFTQISGAKLTVYEEVAFGLEHAGVPREEMRRRIDEALRLLGLEAVKDQSPFALSGGQMQRLAIASVLAMEPEVLILDEPTSQLDPAGTEEVFEAVTALCRRGMAVVMAEHKVDRLAEHADRILVLHQGRQIAYGPPRQVFARENVAALGVAVPAVTQAAKALGWVLEDGTYPVTLAEAVAVGQARRGGR
ncbi:MULTISPECIES: energy-coupling factor ABC transporter ATP-binding protein [Limnochorda]|uniref:energy-coupling factor ABC transporter ATP-binding protein n=1 Tax=Limnochorda TaxID=1676651 RepID=UPI001841E024|nr:ABC transporter ATP-binding protein [Limnochorda pilosa]MBO2486682.1 cobalt ABC transporter ATP-binding protein [Bacillota bacterium]MBO2519985.1 cobalt ABC transporter ATP-binding protein [Bacillota bacterium]NMA70378.1 ABC transporter ATP-binding protein [Bacillota bacterium]